VTLPQTTTSEPGAGGAPTPALVLGPAAAPGAPADVAGWLWERAHSRRVRTLGHPARASDYLELAWLISSLATVGGALGAGLESDDAVRQAAYSYRPDRAARGMPLT
jgi:hypothetical protein